MSTVPPHLRPGYTPSPQKARSYNGPDIPQSYDPDWQHFTNLTKDQIAWFQAQPEWSDFISYVSAAGPAAMINSAVSVATIMATLNNARPISK